MGNEKHFIPEASAPEKAADFNEGKMPCTIHTADDEAHVIEEAAHGEKTESTVEFAKEGHIPSGRSEAFESTLVNDSAAIGWPGTKMHSTIHTADGEAHVIENPAHGVKTESTVEFAKDGHIPSGRSEAFEMTFEYDAAAIGSPETKVPDATHTADDEAHVIDRAARGEKTESWVELMKRGYIPSGRSEAFESTFEYEAAAIGHPEVKTHCTIHKADDEAHPIEDAVHGEPTEPTVEFAKDGHIPSGRIILHKHTFVCDAAAIGCPEMAAGTNVTLVDALADAHCTDGSSSP